MTRKHRSHVRILIYWPWAIFCAFARLYIYLIVFVFCFLPVTVLFQKISIPPPPPRMVLSIRPPHPLGISVPEGSCITAPPPGISYFPFHGLKLPYLEIIDCVPFKINCSHLKTQLFVIFYLFIIFYKTICISYAGTRHENRGL